MQFLRELTVGQRRLFFVGAIVLAVLVAFTAYKRSYKFGDFDVQRQFGIHLLLGKPIYQDRLCYNYMPIAALYAAPLAPFPAPLGSVLRSLTGLACLIYALRTLQRMSPGTASRTTSDLFTSAAMAIIFAGHYIMRFRAAIYSTIATVGWIALPAAYMGPSTWYAAQSEWNLVAIRALSGPPDDNEQRIQNQSLKPALLRLLTAYPNGHILKVDHPLDFPLLDLPPRTAKLVAAAGLAGLLAAFGYWSRKPYRAGYDPARLPEFAALLILMTLYSPATWLQHLTWVVPAVWLIAESYRVPPPWCKAAKFSLGLFLLISLGLNRELLGRDLYYVLLSWHLHTLCQLLLLGLLVYVRSRAEAAAETEGLPARSGSPA
ncbi:MAG: hypothetical protein K8U03_16530 [Planctomycetia bacterium]|nr:hypothetical protein [Planctomycetia bacterium]